MVTQSPTSNCQKTTSWYAVSWLIHNQLSSLSFPLFNSTTFLAFPIIYSQRPLDNTQRALNGTLSNWFYVEYVSRLRMMLCVALGYATQCNAVRALPAWLKPAKIRKNIINVQSSRPVLISLLNTWQHYIFKVISG